MMLLWPLLIVGIVYYFYNNGQPRQRREALESPEELLKARFVRGEIDEETYLKMKAVLR